MGRFIHRALMCFVPQQLIERHQQRQARRAIVFSFAVLLWAPVFALIYYSLGSTVGFWIITILAAIMLLAMFSLRWTKSVFLTGQMVAAIIFIVMTGLATRTGGPSSASLWWLPSVPIIALVICGIRSGIVQADSAR